MCFFDWFPSSLTNRLLQLIGGCEVLLFPILASWWQKPSVGSVGPNLAVFYRAKTNPNQPKPTQPKPSCQGKYTVYRIPILFSKRHHQWPTINPIQRTLSSSSSKFQVPAKLKRSKLWSNFAENVMVDSIDSSVVTWFWELLWIWKKTSNPRQSILFFTETTTLHQKKVECLKYGNPISSDILIQKKWPFLFA